MGEHATATATETPGEAARGSFARGCKVPLRAWVFTINNYTPEDESAVLALASQEGKIKRMAVGKEVAPTTGTPHLQGYVRFVKSVRQGQVCAALGGRAHVEPRVADEPTAAGYALKGGEVFVNFGQDYDPRKDVEEERSRSSAVRVIKMIDSGATPREIWAENRVFFMYNAKRIREEVSRHAYYAANPHDSGFAPVDRPL